jgi:hypothetical protein
VQLDQLDLKVHRASPELLEPQVQLVLRVQRVLRELKARKDHLVLPAPLDPRGHKALPVLKEHRALRELLESREQLVLREHKDHQVLPVHKDLQE